MHMLFRKLRMHMWKKNIYTLAYMNSIMQVESEQHFCFSVQKKINASFLYFIYQPIEHKSTKLGKKKEKLSKVMQNTPLCTHVYIYARLR